MYFAYALMIVGFVFVFTCELIKESHKPNTEQTCKCCQKEEK